MKRFIIVVMFFLSTFLVSAMGVNNDREEAADAFTQFFYHLSQHDTESAYGILSDASRSAYDLQSFSSWRAYVDKAFELDNYSIWFRTSPQNYRKPYKSILIDGITYSRAFIVSATIVVTDKRSGHSFEQVIDRFVVKENDQWRIILRNDGIDSLIGNYQWNERERSNSEQFASDLHEIPAKTINTYQNGELKDVDGVPFLRLYGSYYDMGLQYGILLSANLHDAYEMMAEALASTKSSLSPSMLTDMEQLLDQQYLDQIRGIADGSGIDVQDILIASWFGELRRVEQCSSILVRTESGLLHGRNLDDIAYSAENPVIIEYNPEKGQRCLVFSVVGDIGISEGINTSGVSVSGNSGPGDLTDRGLLGLPYALFRKKIIESALNLDDTKELLSNHLSSTGTIIAIGSGAEDRGVVSEHMYDDHVLIDMDTRGTVFATNTYSEISSSQTMAAESCGRYQQIDDFITRNTIQTIDDMIYLLSLPNEPFGVNNRNTIHSVVLQPDKRKVYFANASGFAAAASWYMYDWENDIWYMYRPSHRQELFL